MDALGDGEAVLKLVLAGDLGLSVGANPRADAVLADLGKLGSKGGGKHVGEGHELLSLVGGVSKHDSLISGSDILVARSKATSRGG